MIRPPRPEELDEAAALIASQQAHPENRNAFFGDTPAEVAALLASWDTPWVDTSRVAERDGQLVGFIGAEIDESLSRVWIHGPVVSDSSWDATADALLTALDAQVPQISGKDQELAGDVANEQLAAFATEHGFTAGKVHHVLSLAASSIERLPDPALQPISAAHEYALLALHDALFPGMYYSGRQLLDLAASGDGVLLGVIDGAELIGYTAGRIDEGGNGYIDFVGVAAERRRRGHGAALVAGLSRAFTARGRIEKVTLTVSSENAAALALYDVLRFERATSAVGYRRPAELSG